MSVSFQFKEFADCLNVKIALTLLKTHTQPSVIFKIDLSVKLKAFLKKKYNITGRFKKIAELTSDVDVVFNNYYNQTDCCQIFQDSFQIKLTNEKVITVVTKKNDTIERISLLKNPFATIKYLRENKLQISQSERLFLDQFRHKKNIKNKN